MKKNSGFTLIELMLTVIIVGVLLMLGVPSLKAFMQSNQLVAASNELVSALHVARSEAIKLNRRVTVCVSANGKRCANSNKWQKGWIVFVDSDDNRVGSGVKCQKKTDISTDCVLRIHSAIDDDQLSITGKYDVTKKAIKWFTFTSRGLPKDGGASLSGILNVCSYDDAGAVASARAVILSLTGRVRVSDNPAKIKCPAAP